MGASQNDIVPGEGILKAQHLIAWKRQRGVLKVPVPPSKVVISMQPGIVSSRQGLFTRQIRGLTGMHLCVDTVRGVYLSGGWGIGAPALVAVCEELHALGANEFYLAGMCGRLTEAIGEGGVVVAGSAIREEGTSQHYLPAGAGTEINNPDPAGVKLLSQLPGARTEKFVSTDAPFRETPAKCIDWITRGATVVDMEAAALYAFAGFTGLKTCAVGVGADLLAGGKWAMAADYPAIEKSLSKTIDQLIEIVKQ